MLLGTRSAENFSNPQFASITYTDEPKSRLGAILAKKRTPLHFIYKMQILPLHFIYKTTQLIHLQVFIIPQKTIIIAVLYEENRYRKGLVSTEGRG